MKKITGEYLKGLFGDLKTHETKTWVLLPTNIPRQSEAEFLAVLHKCRAVLEHETWGDATEEARRISQVGGTGLVHVISIKRTVNMLDSFDNGNSTSLGKKKK
jgi:hypothetical protein